jgi:uncharacterized protein YndB with AHSA1/START domain
MATETTHDMIRTRTFHAPVEDVWRAWVDPDLIKRWWGPEGFTAPVAEMDVRVGGTSLVCMRAPESFGGFEVYNTWTYGTVIPNERLEFVQAFTDRDRTPIDPIEAGLPPGVPREVPHVVTFTSVGPDRTELRGTESGYAAEDIVAVSRAGMTSASTRWLPSSPARPGSRLAPELSSVCERPRAPLRAIDGPTRR